MSEAVAFRTKPALALAMIERALDAGVPCRWVTGDEVYGGIGGCGFSWSNGVAVHAGSSL